MQREKRWGGLFEHLQPLPHHLEINEREASDVPARMRQARNEALLDGIVDRHHTMGMELVACRSARMTGVVCPTITSDASATSSAACARMRPTSAPPKRASIWMLPPSVHPNLLKRGHSGLSFPIIGRSHQLRPRRKRPRNHRRAWLRTFVVRCSLPCDPPMGSFMQWGMIPRFQPLVVSGGKAQSEQMCSGLRLKADFPILV